MGIALPLVVAVGGCVLAIAFVAPGVDLDSMTRGVIGPATWPKAMLYCAAASAAVLAILKLLEARGLRSAHSGLDRGSEYHETRSLGLLAALIIYGAGIPLVGIAWATLSFLAAWLLLSGLRRPLLVGLVSVLGTLGVLYLFVKVSLMPLPRGSGAFEQASVALYRVLGIY